MSDSQAHLPLFVYGTLRSGATAFHKVRDSVRIVFPATLHSQYALYSCGKFPAAVEEKERSHISGELLYFYEDKYETCMNTISAYEGEGWLFSRRQVEVSNDTVNVAVQALIFVAVPGGLIIDKRQRIVSGDWFKRGQ